MAKDCKDAQGRPIDCDSIKGNFKPSDDSSKGAKMKTIRSLSDDQKQWLKDNPNYKGERKPISKVGEKEDKLYLSPSKDDSQTELLRMQKKGASLLTNTTLEPRYVTSEETENNIDRGEVKKIKVEIGKSKANKPKSKRSLFNTKTKTKKYRSKNSLYKCKKKGCVAKGERSIKKQKNKRR